MNTLVFLAFNLALIFNIITSPFSFDSWIWIFITNASLYGHLHFNSYLHYLTRTCQMYLQFSIFTQELKKKNMLCLYPSIEMLWSWNSKHRCGSLTHCWRLPLRKIPTWLKTAARALPVFCITTQLSSIVTSNILQKLLETWGCSDTSIYKTVAVW